MMNILLYTLRVELIHLDTLLIQIGVDFALKVLNWDDNTTIRLQIWDIAGELLIVSFNSTIIDWGIFVI